MAEKMYKPISHVRGWINGQITIGVAIYYVQIFHGFPFLPYEGHVLLIEAQPIITFCMKILSKKVYQRF